MRPGQPIQVFEHQLLPIAKEGFRREHWEKLGRYCDRHGHSWCTLLPDGVKFHQYVGVIQLGNISIEILPKVERTVAETEKAKWQQVLIDMLRECHWMQVFSHDSASLKLKTNSILDAYIEVFIRECESIVREGLVRKYRLADRNGIALKGRLLFAQQIRHNLVHQERSYTRHQLYDRENIFNKILLKALKLLPSITRNPVLKDRIYDLLLSFPELEDMKVTGGTFAKLVYDRKTDRYQEAMKIAAMLLLNYRPDISGGSNHVLAILFDMNELWEEYIFRQLRKHLETGWTISPQSSKPFWQLLEGSMSKKIRPDIVITNKEGQRFILDTKWKLPDYGIPGDEDLKQMFIYNDYWESKLALLVYPDAVYKDEPEWYMGAYHAPNATGFKHHCGVLKISVLDSNDKGLDRSLGKRIAGLLPLLQLVGSS